MDRREIKKPAERAESPIPDLASEVILPPTVENRLDDQLIAEGFLPPQDPLQAFDREELLLENHPKTVEWIQTLASDIATLNDVLNLPSQNKSAADEAAEKVKRNFKLEHDCFMNDSGEMAVRLRIVEESSHGEKPERQYLLPHLLQEAMTGEKGTQNLMRAGQTDDVLFDGGNSYEIYYDDSPVQIVLRLKPDHYDHEPHDIQVQLSTRAMEVSFDRLLEKIRQEGQTGFNYLYDVELWLQLKELAPKVLINEAIDSSAQHRVVPDGVPETSYACAVEEDGDITGYRFEAKGVFVSATFNTETKPVVIGYNTPLKAFEGLNVTLKKY